MGFSLQPDLANSRSIERRPEDTHRHDLILRSSYFPIGLFVGIVCLPIGPFVGILVNTIVEGHRVLYEYN